MVRSFEVLLNAAHPELPLFETSAIVGTPSTAFIRRVPASVGSWHITKVYVQAEYPDSSNITVEARVGAEGVWTATLPATQASGRVRGGFMILADGVDENGDPISGYCLGIADFAVYTRDLVIAPGPVSYTLHLFDAPPDPAKKGDVAFFGGLPKIYTGAGWSDFANLANYYTKGETDAAIEAVAAYYITYTAAGANFPTAAALTGAAVYYSGGEVRTPTRNDYAVVLADETHGGATWRYIYAVPAGATSGQWEPQYQISTSDYRQLSHQPSINDVPLEAGQTARDLGLADLSEVALPVIDSETPPGYAVGDVGFHAGAVYKCVTAIPAWRPGDAPRDWNCYSSYWQKLFDFDTAAPAQGGTKLVTNGQVFAALPKPGTDLPKIAGTAAAGVKPEYSKQDHVHPAETSAEVAFAFPAELLPVTYTEGGHARIIQAQDEAELYVRGDEVHLEDDDYDFVVARFAAGSGVFVAEGADIEEGSLKFNGTAPTANTWPCLARDTVVKVRGTVVSGKADEAAVAPVFDPNKAYAAGEAVMYEGRRFYAVADRAAGPFSRADFAEESVEDFIQYGLSELDYAKADRAPARPLCFTAEEASSAVTLAKVGSFTLPVSLVYSTNGGATWADYTVGTAVSLATVGSSVMFKAKTENARICPDLSGANYHCFQVTGKVAATGDLTSLLGPYADPPEALPQRCFNCLFISCTGLVQAPDLPATRLGPRCYQSLFNGCTGLTESPYLPATALAASCYANLFLNASNVAKVRVAFTAFNPANATTGWLNGVAASGEFYCPPALDTTPRGTATVPSGWTVNPAAAPAGGGVQPEVIAEEYDEVADYEEGDVVIHDGKRWYCIAMETTSGPWDQTQWEEQPVETALDNMRGDIAARLELDKAAPQFSAYVAYAVGDIVRYGGQFYVCTTAHSAGAWNAQHFTISSSRLPGVFKPKQAAVSDPMAAGESGQFIASISQNANGVIAAQKKSIPYGKNNAAGTVWLSDATNSSKAAASDFTAATPLAVKTVADSVGYTATAQVEGGNSLGDYIPDRTITTVTPETSDFDSHWGFTAAARSGNRLRDFYLYVEMGATYEPTTFHLDSGLVRYPYASPAATPTLQPGHCYLIHFREVAADIFTCTVDDLI